MRAVCAASLVAAAFAIRSSPQASHLELQVHNETRVAPGTIGCGEYDLDKYADADGETCYMRVYRCDSHDRPNPANTNVGDAAWAVSSRCHHYGKVLNVYQVEIKRDVLSSPHGHYEQCNHGHCPCSPYAHGECTKESHGVGWRHETHPSSSYQYSLPGAFEGSEWTLKHKEHTFDLGSCIMKYVDEHASLDARVAALGDILKNRPHGC
eukprot:TRINITY_DN25677_c0_g1_i2.p1 TRINITY_DN25677_c0_g1~~TRINITY_DN25677_c0_g1_i2.p1  ORF type:complete len:209 (+),score=26.04 TRINITY_DN25677_c0_g1_i2:144-770(+)